MPKTTQAKTLERQLLELRMAYLGMAAVLCEAKHSIRQMRYGGDDNTIDLDDECLDGINRALTDVAKHTRSQVMGINTWKPYIEPQKEES